MTPRRSQPSSNPEVLRKRLVELLEDFENKLRLDNHLREKVQALIPAFHTLRDLGSSLIPIEDGLEAARSRILKYLQTYPRQVISGEELMVVAGINEWPRRTRELRHELGWNIVTGKTAREMVEASQDDFLTEDDPQRELLSSMRPDDYILLSEHQDRDQAYRFNVANTIRKKRTSVAAKTLEYLIENVGKPVSGEELRYVAKDKTEWARRVRELRTQEGWAVKTRSSGRPDLPTGMYILEHLDQLPEHDRHISDYDRKQALVRDNHACQAHQVGLSQCLWTYAKGKETGDYRILELHHLEHHVAGGSNEVDNLITLCNVCHDRLHKMQR